MANGAAEILNELSVVIIAPRKDSRSFRRDQRIQIVCLDPKLACHGRVMDTSFRI